MYSVGTFSTGHVEEPEAFRPGEDEQGNRADAQLEHLHGGMPTMPCRAVPCVYKSVRGRRVGGAAFG